MGNRIPLRTMLLNTDKLMRLRVVCMMMIDDFCYIYKLYYYNYIYKIKNKKVIEKLKIKLKIFRIIKLKNLIYFKKL